MITIEKDFPLTSSYPLSRLGKPKDLLFFDIETTGFSGSCNTVYLIGCVWAENGRLRFIQWFADSKAAESEVLNAFFAFLKNFKILVHFNGDTFDIPFLLKRCRALKLSHTFDGVESVDIYKRIKPWKKHLGLTSLKQKAIETFLGIERDDLFGGGELIAVYEDYLRTKNEDALHLLLLHNEDDLKGMPALLPILFYPDFFNQEFALSDLKKAAGETPRLILTLDGCPETLLPTPVSASVPSYAFRAEKNRLMLSVRIYEGTLKYYYPNYKDYYYLIYEDTAIHKSVGEYVDKDARIKATKETCYTKRAGIFLPQPAPVWTPDFRTSCKDKSCFFQFDTDGFSDSEKLNLYIRDVIKYIFAA